MRYLIIICSKTKNILLNYGCYVQKLKMLQSMLIEPTSVEVSLYIP